MRFEQDTKECYIHVKIQSCQDALDVSLQLKGLGQDPLKELKVDIGKEDSEEDVCLSVPCKGGRLTEPMRIIAKASADEELVIAVSPEQLPVDFSGLKEDSTNCYGDPFTPADVNVTCPGEEEEGMTFHTGCNKHTVHK